MSTLKSAMFFLLILLSQDVHAQILSVTNHTGLRVDLWTRESGTDKYQLVSRKLLNNYRVPLAINNPPVFVAVSPRADKFLYFGPFHLDNTSTTELVLDARTVYEAKDKTIWYWNRRCRRWEHRQNQVTVSKVVYGAQLIRRSDRENETNLLEARPSEAPLQPTEVPLPPPLASPR